MMPRDKHVIILLKNLNDVVLFVPLDAAILNLN